MFLSTSVLNNLMKKAYKTGLVVARMQDEQTGQIYPVNNVFVSIINNAMVEEDKGEYTVTEPLFNPLRGILWKNNVCKLRAHFRTDDKNIKVLKSLKGVDLGGRGLDERCTQNNSERKNGKSIKPVSCTARMALAISA